MRIGIVGTNQISEQFASACRSVSEVTLHSVYSRKEDTGEAFAERNKIPHVFTDYAEFLADKALDAVYIASPNCLHAPQSRKALLYGKHVLCEKPIAVSEKKFQDVLDTAGEVNLVYMEAMRPLYDPALSYVIKEMANIGTVRQIHLDFSQYSSRYDAFRSGNIQNAFSPKLSNAAVMDLGVYPIAWCEALLGMPDRIQSSSKFLDNGFEGCGSILLGYFKGPEVAITYSKITTYWPPGTPSNLIAGEEGTIYIEGNLNSPKCVRTVMRTGEVKEKQFTYAPDNMKYEITWFLNLVKDRNANHAMLKHTQNVLRILDTVRENNHITF